MKTPSGAPVARQGAIYGPTVVDFIEVIQREPSEIGFRIHPRHFSVEVEVESFYVGCVLPYAPD
jgi:hypothetical protein